MMETNDALVGLFVLLWLPAMSRSVLHSWRGLPSPRRRRSTEDAWLRLLHQLTLIVVLAGTWYLGWWEGQAVGIRWTWWSVPIGVLANVALGALNTVLQRGMATPMDLLSHVRRMRRQWPRSKTGQALESVAFCLNPATEELVTRGIFVCVVHTATGSFLCGFLFGLLINQVLHAGNGPQKLPYHAVGYTVFVALTYSPVGLLGAIVCHMSANMPHLNSRQKLRDIRDYRAWMRRTRSV